MYVIYTNVSYTGRVNFSRLHTSHTHKDNPTPLEITSLHQLLCAAAGCCTKIYILLLLLYYVSYEYTFVKNGKKYLTKKKPFSSTRRGIYGTRTPEPLCVAYTTGVPPSPGHKPVPMVRARSNEQFEPPKSRPLRARAPHRVV